MKISNWIIVGFILLILFGCASNNQNVKRTDLDKTEIGDPVPVDPLVRTGKFANGLRYLIRQNTHPENRAELRLVVNAGSVLEDDDQLGLAHFCEHMAFNGTRDFAKQEIVDYLESIGMRFGPEINAYTNFDETVYMLELPTDNGEILETAFQILENWAHLIEFESEEIDRERGVIIEEWRLGRGAGARMLDKQLPIIFKGSKYADRLTIGDKEILETFDHDVLRRFYRDWYRPDLMAVIAIGDFDVDNIETLIRQHFENIPARPDGRPRTLFSIPDHDETLFAIATDPEATQTQISIYTKTELMPDQTISDYRGLIINDLFDELMNIRLDELLQQADPPYLYAFSGKGQFVRSKGVITLAAGVEQGGIPRGLDALLTEAKRVHQYGFTQAELDRVKKSSLRSMERAYLERDKTESHIYASEYIRHILTGEPIPGIEWEYDQYQQIIPKITLAEINGLAKERMTDKNRVITVNAPESVDIPVPTESDLMTIFIGVDKKEIDPYVNVNLNIPLIEVIPAPGDIVTEKVIDTLNVTEWTLSNGIRVILKPTDFKNDEIIFTSFSPGGHSLVEDEDFLSAVAATALITQSGLGAFDNTGLQRKLAGKAVRVTPFVNGLMEGIRGGASPQDVETMFKLIHLYFTSPRKDSTAYLSYKSRLQGFLANRSARPESAFGDTLQVTLAQYHYRARPWSNVMLDEIDLDKSIRFYQDRFADAGDFTFIFIGNFDGERLKSLVETYLGGLPTIARNESWRDIGMDPPKGKVDKTVRRGMEAKGRVHMTITGEKEWTREGVYHFNSMIEALEKKLREVIREELGGTYGVNVNASHNRIPKLSYNVTIDFGCDPEKIDELTDAVYAEIDTLKTVGPSLSMVDKIKESQLRQHETRLKENGFWLGLLYRSALYGTDPMNLYTYTDLVNGLTAEQIRLSAIDYLGMENVVRVVLKPEM